MEEKQVDKPTEEKKAESANTFTFNFSNLPQSAQSTTLPTDVENATPEQLKQVIKEKLEKEVKEKISFSSTSCTTSCNSFTKTSR